MEEKDNLSAKIDALSSSLGEVRKDVGDIKLVLEGSPMGATGMSKRVHELEKKVMELKVFQWKAIGILSIAVPVLLHFIEKYL